MEWQFNSIQFYIFCIKLVMIFWACWEIKRYILVPYVCLLRASLLWWLHTAKASTVIRRCRSSAKSQNTDKETAHQRGTRQRRGVNLWDCSIYFYYFPLKKYGTQSKSAADVLMSPMTNDCIGNCIFVLGWKPTWCLSVLMKTTR